MTEEEKNRLSRAHQAHVKRALRIRWAFGVVALLLVGGLVGWFLMISNFFGFDFKEMRHHWTWGLLGAACILFILSLGGESKNQPLHTRNPVQTEGVPNTTLIRFGLCCAFHLTLGYASWIWLDRYAYPEGFIRSCLDLTAVVLIGLSIIDTFDWSLKYNEKAEVTYFGKKLFSNVGPGLVCLGLPKWLITALEAVDFNQSSITIGLVKNGVRQPFVVQWGEKDIRVVFDIMFMVSVCNTRKYLELNKKEIEKIWVELVNGVLFALINGDELDPVTGEPLLVDGKPVPYIKEFGEFRTSTTRIAIDMMKDTTSEGVVAKFEEKGFTIHSITIKDIQRENTLLADTTQKEEAEFMSIQNKIMKTQEVYNAYNRIGQPNEVKPGDPEYVTMKEAEEIVERDAGGVKTVNVGGKGGSTAIVDGRQ